MRIRNNSEKGSYTIEALISMVTMVIAIAFVYSMVKMVICECIMQHAVDNMALEVASYVYILDKTGIVIHSDDDTMSGLNSSAEQGANAVQEGRDMLQLFNDDDGFNVTDLMDMLNDTEGSTGAQINDKGKNLVDSIKKMIEELKKVDFEKELKQGASIAVDGAITVALNKAMEVYYGWKLESYLPMELDDFCNAYYIDKNSISFKASRVFPGTKNNTVLVVVSYETTSPYKLFPIKRKVVKQAYTAAWLTDPQ